MCSVLMNSANSAWSIASAKSMMPWRYCWYLRKLQEKYVGILENSKEDYFKDKPCLSRHVSEATVYWLEALFLGICQHENNPTCVLRNYLGPEQNNTISGKTDENTLKWCCLWSFKLSNKLSCKLYSDIFHFLGVWLSKSGSRPIARIVKRRAEGKSITLQQIVQHIGLLQQITILLWPVFY